jgi:hypothetical protein
VYSKVIYEHIGSALHVVEAIVEVVGKMVKTRGRSLEPTVNGGRETPVGFRNTQHYFLPLYNRVHLLLHTIVRHQTQNCSRLSGSLEAPQGMENCP